MLSVPPPAPLLAAPSALVVSASIPDVPFYSQLRDITYPKWQKVGCGVTSLAMIIDYYKPPVLVDRLLAQATSSGAYLPSAGWTYSGLIAVAKKYGLNGSSFDLAKENAQAAFGELKESLRDGPVIASVHYKFDPKSSVPHLVVITGVADGVVYYNDPAAQAGEESIPAADFLKAWKKRFIVLRPAPEVALAN